MNLISVIVPVYNVEPYLERCVESIRKQTHKRLEIILVDDGSPDECPELCEGFKELDDRISVIHKENGGLGFARNSGLEVATGDYVTFVDSDDWISEKHIENLYRVAVENLADVVIGAHTTVSSNGNQQIHSVQIKPGLYEGEQITEGIILPLLGPDLLFPRDVQLTSSSCMNLYSMELIRANKLRFISERFAVAEDLYFNVDVFAQARCIAVSNEYGYYYFENVGSISRKYEPKRFERTLNYYETIKERATRYGLADVVGYRIDRSFIMKIRVAVRHVVLSGLSIKEKCRVIKEILNDSTVQGVLWDYPIETFTRAMRIPAKLMRDGKAYTLLFIIKFRETARNLRLLRELLKRFGIGK